MSKQRENDLIPFDLEPAIKLNQRISEQQLKRKIYNQRPFKEEYQQLENRLVEQAISLTEHLSEKDIPNIEVSAEEHKLIWQEIDASAVLHDNKRMAYNPESIYMLSGLFVVKLKKKDKV